MCGIISQSNLNNPVISSNDTLARMLYSKYNMDNNTKTKYDLEERTYIFAKQVTKYIKLLPKNLTNIEFGKQLIRSAGSVGANYIEANEALSKKEFLMRIKISRKEAKESGYWLRLSDVPKTQLKMKEDLIQESIELTKIFGSIVTKSTSKL
jgi:four helix bundle protein